MASRKETPDVLGELLGGAGLEPVPPLPAPAAAPAPPKPKKAKTPGSTPARTPKTPAPAPIAELPVQWEYLEVVFRDYRGWRAHAVNGRELGNWKNAAPLVDYVKRLGDEGWEMVSMSDQHRNQKEAYFKRRKPVQA
jgi:hypothetical protein